jgi:CHRD domain
LPFKKSLKKNETGSRFALQFYAHKHILTMNKTNYYLLPMLLFASILAMPLKAQSPLPHLVFHAELSGSEAIPAVNTDAKCLITLIFTADRKKVDVSGLLVGMDGPVTEATIHLGITGQTGPVLLDFLPIVGRHIKGQLDVTPALLENLLINGVYADIRTTVHPNGEIRGQFTCETDLDYSALLTSSQAIPPNNSTAIAFGGIHFPLGAEDFVYAFTFNGLSSAITSVGIYDQTGALAVAMPGMAGGLLQGLVELDTIDPAFLRRAREGAYYIVIKTVNFPNGEIQGKLKHVGYFGSSAPIYGGQVPPPVPLSPGFGWSTSVLNGTLDSLTTTAFINNITTTTAKIHIGNPGAIGPELVTLDPTTSPGLYTKKYKITDAQLTDFAQGRLYVNVPTTTYPIGEIRGVMKNTLRKAYAFDLCGIQMVPPTSSSALGISVASVDQANCYLHYKVISEGLSGVPIDGYFAQGVFGANGTAFHSTPLTAPVIEGSHEIMAVLGPIIENSGTYVQIASPSFPMGEIRGQVRRGFSCPEVVAIGELENLEQVLVSPVPFKEVLNVTFKSTSAFEGRLVMYDMMGIPALTQSVRIVTGEQSFEIQTMHLPKGIYSISLEIPGKDASMLLKKVVRVE